jgi:hypothetical protein
LKDIMMPSRLFRHLIAIAAVFLNLAFPKASSALVFGLDDRTTPGAYLKPSERFRYGLVGGFQCKNMAGKDHFSTGTLAVNRETVVTAAHPFIERWTGKIINQQCVFVLLWNGKLIDKVEIKQIYSPWQSKYYRCDPSNDYAVIKLVRTINYPDAFIPAYNSIYHGEDVSLTAYHNDLSPANILRISNGSQHSIDRDSKFLDHFIKDGCRVNNPNRIMAANYDSFYGSSGGPVWQRGGIVGINIGYFNTFPVDDVFSNKYNFNYFIALDENIAKDVIKMAGKSLPDP